MIGKTRVFSTILDILKYKPCPAKIKQIESNDAHQYFKNISDKIDQAFYIYIQ